MVAMVAEKKHFTTEQKFQREMHHEIRVVAGMYDVTATNVKNRLRDELIRRGLIEFSTKELDLKGYAIGVEILQSWKNSRWRF